MRIAARIVAVVLLLSLAGQAVACEIGHLSRRRSSESMRSRILSKCPLGASFDDVLAELKRKNLHPKPDLRFGFRKQVEAGHGYRSDTVGSTSIAVDLGDYRGALPYLVLATSVTVYWGFDADGRLIDVLVRKDVDGP